ncbi:unnamed protein product, partial [Amoebophrya sp. A25]|eukprot:GSA25T00019260001.1
MTRPLRMKLGDFLESSEEEPVRVPVEKNDTKSREASITPHHSINAGATSQDDSTSGANVGGGAANRDLDLPLSGITSMASEVEAMASEDVEEMCRSSEEAHDAILRKNEAIMAEVFSQTKTAAVDNEISGMSTSGNYGAAPTSRQQSKQESRQQSKPESRQQSKQEPNLTSADSTFRHGWGAQTSSCGSAPIGQETTPFSTYQEIQQQQEVLDDRLRQRHPHVGATSTRAGAVGVSSTAAAASLSSTSKMNVDEETGIGSASAALKAEATQERPRLVP